MKKILSVVLLILLAGCASIPQVLYTDQGLATPTPDEAALYAEAISAQRALEDARIQAEQAQATADSYNGRLTATAAVFAQQSTSQAFEAGSRQTEQVWHLTATAALVQAAQTATADAWQRTATQAAYDRQATESVAEIQAQATQQAIIAESNRLVLDRERMVNQVRAVAPWVIIILTFALLAFLVIVFGRAQARRPQIIQRDARGDAPILFDGRNIIDPDRIPGPALTTGDTPRLPEGVTDPLVTERDQAIDAINRGLPGQTRRGSTTPPAFPTLPRASIGSGPYRIYGAGERPALPPDVVDILDGEWRELDD